MKPLSLITLCALSVSAATQLFAAEWTLDEAALANLSAEEKGKKIAEAVDLRENGFVNQRATLQMELVDRHGQSNTRQMRTKTLEVADDGDKTLIIFDSPRDVAGTALLSFTHRVGDDDQWLYLPALKRVKRIASRNKSGPFVGSTFAYEDLTSQEVPKYTYTYLRDDEIDGEAVWVVGYDPVDPNSGYTIQETWISKEHYRFEKVEYFDRKKSALKTLRWTGYNLYEDRYWRADAMIMDNHQKGTSTTLHWKNYEFKTDLSERDFTQAALKRARAK